jgi:hypothetical protein
MGLREAAPDKHHERRGWPRRSWMPRVVTPVLSQRTRPPICLPLPDQGEAAGDPEADTAVGPTAILDPVAVVVEVDGAVRRSEGADGVGMPAERGGHAWVVGAEGGGALLAIPGEAEVPGREGCPMRCGSNDQIPGADRHTTAPNGQVPSAPVVSRLPERGGILRLTTHSLRIPRFAVAPL